MDVTHVIDWSREALRMSLTAGRASAGGRTSGRASGQRRADLDPVARARGRADPAHRGGGPGPALDPSLAAGPLGVVRQGLDRVDPQLAVNS